MLLYNQTVFNGKYKHVFQFHLSLRSERSIKTFEQKCSWIGRVQQKSVLIQIPNPLWKNFPSIHSKIMLPNTSVPKSSEHVHVHKTLHTNVDTLIEYRCNQVHDAYHVMHLTFPSFGPIKRAFSCRETLIGDNAFPHLRELTLSAFFFRGGGVT